jgi:hypothetical protein
VQFEGGHFFGEVVVIYLAALDLKPVARPKPKIFYLAGPPNQITQGATLDLAH